MILEKDYNLLFKNISRVLEGFDWYRCEYLMSFTDGAGGGGYAYYDKNGVKHIPYYVDEQGFKSVKELEDAHKIYETFRSYFKECRYSEDLKWNKGVITFDRNGHYEDEFSWDNEAYLDDIEGGVWSAIYYLSTFFEDYFNHELTTYEDWEKADINIYVKEGTVEIEGIVVIKGEATHFTKDLPDKIVDGLILMQRDTTEGKLNSRFSKWNTLRLHLINRQYFEVKDQTEFLWK